MKSFLLMTLFMFCLTILFPHDMNALELGENMQTRVQENSVYYLEIVTPEVDSLCKLYTQTLGWKFSTRIPELGNARTAELPDGSLCGIRAPMHEQEKPIVRTYILVADLDKRVKEVADLGAEILIDRMEIPGYGFIAIYKLGGIEQGLWQVE